MLRPWGDMPKSNCQHAFISLAQEHPPKSELPTLMSGETGCRVFLGVARVHFWIACEIIRKYFRCLCFACGAFFSPAPVSPHGCGMDISARTPNSLLGLCLLPLTVSDSIPSGVRHGHFGSNSELSTGLVLATSNVPGLGTPMPQCLSATNLGVRRSS